MILKETLAVLQLVLWNAIEIPLQGKIIFGFSSAKSSF